MSQMAKHRRDRSRRSARRPAFRDPKPIILIVCEGENTEPQYFRGLKLDARNSRVDIQIPPEQGVPRTLVEVAKRYKRLAEVAAKREKDLNLVYDEVWCVFDIDDHPNVAEARDMARSNDIRLAISNPCFELWLLLHFRDNPGMQDRITIKRMLSQFVPEYDKTVEYSTYSTGYANAVTRAARLSVAAEAAGEAGRNPTTNVYELTGRIRDEDV